MTVENVKKAIAALKSGQLIIIADDLEREAEGDLVGLASNATSESVNFMTQNARGLLCAPVTQTVAQRLALKPMTTDSTDAFGTAFTISVDHRTTTTGISAKDRAATIRALADKKSQSMDFWRPGHLFPLIAQPGGVLKRRGHTEAAVDLAQFAGEEAAYICEILEEDGQMARLPRLERLAQKWQLVIVTIDEISDYLTRQKKADVRVKLPTRFGQFDLALYVDNQGKEQLILSMGDWQHTKQPPLVRIHSECLTGDVFGSQRCDCGDQLAAAMSAIAKAGCGAILYMRQEGRGIGLFNKLQAYQLQEKGLDTYEANIALGFKPDERHYDVAAWLLRNEGVTRIKLLTNNPDKIAQLKALGIDITERISLETQVYLTNRSYLQTKKIKFHHLLTGSALNDKF